MLVYYFLVTALIVVGNASKILAVFSVTSISHQMVFRPLTQELARRGHEVVVITTDPAFPEGETPANFTEIDVHDVSHKVWRELLEAATRKADYIFDQIKLAHDSLLRMFENQISDSEVQKILKDKTKTFDLLLLEACVRPASRTKRLVSVIEKLGFN